MHEKAIEYLMASDVHLARIIRQTGPCRLAADRFQGPFAALVEAVAHQQLTGKAAQTILGRVKALHPRRRFPTPELLLETPDEKLRAAGLSRAKVAAVKDIAAKTLTGVVPTTRKLAAMEDAEIIERLTTIRGVGRWTVEMLLIFKLGRPDVLPADDYGVRVGFAYTYQRSAPPRAAELLEHGERWRPHRSVAAWYLWRAVELSRQKPA